MREGEKEREERERERVRKEGERGREIRVEEERGERKREDIEWHVRSRSNDERLPRTRQKRLQPRAKQSASPPPSLKTQNKNLPPHLTSNFLPPLKSISSKYSPASLGAVPTCASAQLLLIVIG